MVVFESLALIGGLKDIFLYNRDLYMFNRQVNQGRIYQTQKMRIEQILLFRDDLRQLFDLTIGKMESYLVVNTLTLAFCMAFFYEGRMPLDTPSWLFWLWGMSLATAILFLIMSVWFAIYATITAQTFAVRLLTQWLRLPVPSQADITKAAATAAEFEKQSKSTLLRVPIVSTPNPPGGGASSSSSSAVPAAPMAAGPQGPKRSSKGAAGPSDDTRSEAEQEAPPKMVNPALELMFSREYQTFVEHFHLFRSLQENWAGYDAYARVCMVVGSAQLLSVIGYMGIGWYITDHARWGGAVFTILIVVFAIIHARMNLLLSSRELSTLIFFLVAGPLTGCTAAILHYIDRQDLYGTAVAWLAPITFFFHLCSTAFFIAIGSEKDKALPTKFSTVISIDVLGLWEDDKSTEEDEEFDQSERGWDDQARAAMRATGNALTGWQKRWLKATTREAPVSALIPPSMDVTSAERERHLRPRGSANMVLNRMAASSLVLGGDEPHLRQNSLSSARGELAPTKHIQTLPWVAFRQAGAVVILLWLISIAGGIVVAIIGDIPGWDSNPSAHQTIVGVALWQPAPHVVPGFNFSASRKRSLPAPPNVVSLLSTAAWMDTAIVVAPQTAVQFVRGVTREGIHVVTDDARYILSNESKLIDYGSYPWMAPFRAIVASTVGTATRFPNLRAPWCGPSDTVTMVNPGFFRDCGNLGIVWTIEDHPAASSQFKGVTGRYALNSEDHRIYKFQFHRRSFSMRIETRIPLPVSLSGRLVDIAKNEYLMACLTREGFVGLWTTQHQEVPSKGVRVLPNKDDVAWTSIVGAGGRSFVVLGEVKSTGMQEIFFIHDILALPKVDRFQ